MLTSLLTIAVLVVTSPASDTIVAGHAALRGATLRLGTDTTEVYGTRDGVRQLVATGIQSVTRSSSGYVVVQTNQGRAGLSMDSTTLAISTLAPLRHVETLPERHAIFTYANGRLTGTVTDSGKTKSVDVSVSANRFDFSNVQQITSSLPLAAGYEAVVLAYDVAADKDRAIGFSVVAREKIMWGGHEIDAFKTLTDFTTHKVTRWIDAKSRRDIRWEIEMPGMKLEGVVK